MTDRMVPCDTGDTDFICLGCGFHLVQHTAFHDTPTPGAVEGVFPGPATGFYCPTTAEEREIVLAVEQPPTRRRWPGTSATDVADGEDQATIDPNGADCPYDTDGERP